MEEGKAQEFLVYQSKRKIISLSKGFLILLEDIRDEGSISDETYQKLRKKILDSSNDASREMEEYISKMNVSF